MSTSTAEVMRTRPAAPRPAPLSFRSLMLATIWFAVVAGLAESLILLLRQHVFHHLLYRSAHYLWMPSVGAVLVFVTVALLFWSLSRLVRGLRTQRAALTMLLALSALSVFLVTRWLYPPAALVLAAGLAVTVTGRANGVARIKRAMHATLPALLVLVFALAAFSIIRPIVSERRAVAALPRARAGSPNIIFLILDTVRSRSLNLYGYLRNTTPNLNRLAQQGVVFERAIATAPWTLPSHASMFTGRLPQDVNADRFTALDGQYKTVADVLSAHGYATGGFAANLAYASYEFGLERGFHHWDDYQINLPAVLTNSSLGRFILLEGYSGGRNSALLRVLGVERWVGHTRTAAEINDKLLGWIGAQTRPYFVFANYFDTHMPYLPPRPYAGSFGPVMHSSLQERWRTEGPGKWPQRGNPAYERMLRDRYEESIAYLDAQIGALHQELRKRGALDNTIIIVASDHGEEFGENGAYEHDTGLTFSQVHVPLLVVGPHIPHGMKIDKPVSLRDLGSTVLQLSGTSSSELAGTSLLPLWSGNPNAATSPAFAALEKNKKSQAAIVTDRYHYIKQRDSEQLYDHVADPYELHDLIGTPAAAAVLDSLRNALAAQGAAKVFASTKR